VHPFVALMRRYCIDYTNSHDQSLYDEIMEPDYVVHIGGLVLERSTTYAKAVANLFSAAPGLGLVVHDLVLNGDRLSMYFSEHAAMPGRDGPSLACWRGIGLYKWNGTRLTENYVEQDYQALQDQLTGGEPHPLTPPHIDPWTTTRAIPADGAAEAVVRAWLERGDLADAGSVEIDDMRTGAGYEPVLDVESVAVNDLFSAGRSVPFHVTMNGRYRGGLGAGFERHVGAPAALDVVGIARVDGGVVGHLDAITGRRRLAGELGA
jgi:hypothetical protein